MKEWLRYGIAMAGYIVISLFTKHFLTWTMGPIYFITVLEVLPRIGRRLKGEFTKRLSSRRPAPEFATPVAES